MYSIRVETTKRKTVKKHKICYLKKITVKNKILKVLCYLCYKIVLNGFKKGILCSSV